MSRVLGWSSVVGGVLSGSLVALLLIGPMLGFYGWDRHGPGPESSGAIEVPVALTPRPPATASPAGLTSLGTISPVLATTGPPVLTPARSVSQPVVRPGGSAGNRPTPGQAPAAAVPPAPESSQTATAATVAPAPAPAPEARSTGRSAGKKHAAKKADQAEHKPAHAPKAEPPARKQGPDKHAAAPEEGTPVTAVQAPENGEQGKNKDKHGHGHGTVAKAAE